MPRLSVTSAALLSPVSLRTEFSLSLPLRYSMTVDLHADGRDLLEAGLRTLGLAGPEVDEEVELAVGVLAEDRHALTRRA